MYFVWTCSVKEWPHRALVYNTECSGIVIKGGANKGYKVGRVHEVLDK